MQKNLYYDYQLGQCCIKETIAFNPSNKNYYDYVANRLGCSVDQLALLLVNPSFMDSDEEGWTIESFFPVRSHIEVTVSTTDYTTDGFTFGEVVQVVYNGEKFMADHNASPFGVWAKYDFENEEVFEKNCG